MTRTRRSDRPVVSPPKTQKARSKPAVALRKPAAKSRRSAKPDRTANLRAVAKPDVLVPSAAAGAVAPTASVTRPTKADVQAVFTAAKLAYESAKTVLGDNAWGDINAQLARIRALDKGPRRTITIVGAGVAGLAAAYELERLGHHVRILEGNDRLGGRVLTHRFKDGTYHELGAMRIPRSHDYTRHYVEELGLKLRHFVTSGDETDAFYDIDGVKTPIRDAQKTLSPQYHLDAKDAATKDPGAILGRYLKELFDSLTPAEKASLYTTRLASERLKKLDQLSLGDYLKDHVNHDTLQLIGMSTGTGGLMDRSLIWFLREEIRGDGEGLEEIIGGMDQLPHGLADRLQTPIEFETKLQGIRNRDDGKVELTLSQHGGPPVKQVVDEVLMTLPFAVLRGIDTPTFSRGKHEAIREMGYGSATKVLLDAKERFWETRYGIHGGASHSDHITGATYYPSDNATPASKEEQDRISKGPGTLIGSYVWGTDARRLGAMPPEAREQAVIASVARFHPEIAEPGMVKDFATMSWDDNPWSAGAFGVPLPGQHGLYRQAIKPEGNVHFAGEHASLDPGWIQGALISSLRAVEEIITRPPPTRAAKSKGQGP